MLFGLSMDYEVFMVSRIREEYDRTGDTIEAVAHGLSRTGAVVTYAALIMIAIFASFMLSSIPEMKQLGFALAVAVLIDATIVRAMLVPAFMAIAGRWNWWMPKRMDRSRLPLSAVAAALAKTIEASGGCSAYGLRCLRACRTVSALSRMPRLGSFEQARRPACPRPGRFRRAAGGPAGLA